MKESAHYDSSNVCLDGTRLHLRERIGNWLDTEDESELGRLLWLYGHAGSGKSTVANTVATMVETRGHALAYFSCKRDNPYQSNARKVLPYIAYRLAKQCDEYRVKLLEFFPRGL